MSECSTVCSAQMEQVCQADASSSLAIGAAQQQQQQPVLRYSRPACMARSSSGQRKFAAIYETLSIEEKDISGYLPDRPNGHVSLPPTNIAEHAYRADIAASAGQPHANAVPWDQTAFAAHAGIQTASGQGYLEMLGLEATCLAAGAQPASFSSWHSVGSTGNHSSSSQVDLLAENNSGSYDAAVTVQEFHNNSSSCQDHSINTTAAAAAAAAIPSSSAAAYDAHWAAIAACNGTGHHMQQQQQQLPPLPPTPLARTNSCSKNNFGGQGSLMGAHTMPIPFLSMQLPAFGSSPAAPGQDLHPSPTTVSSASPKPRQQFQRASSLTGHAGTSSSSMAAGSSGSRSHPGSFTNLQQQQQQQQQQQASSAAAASAAAAQAAALSNTISCPLPRPPLGVSMPPHQLHQQQQQQQLLLLQQLHQQQQLQHRQALRVLDEEVQQLLLLGRQLEAAKAAAAAGSPAAAACEVATQMHEKAMNRAVQAKAALQLAGAAAGAYEAADILQQHDAHQHALLQQQHQQHDAHQHALLQLQKQQKQQQWAAQQQWMHEQHEQQQWHLMQQQQLQHQQLQQHKQVHWELRKEQRQQQQQQQQDVEELRDSHSPPRHRPVCRSATFAVHGGNEGFHRSQSGPLNPAAHDKLTQLMKVQKMQAALQGELLQLLPMA